MSRATLHDRAGALFLEAVSRPAAERESFVQASCGADTELLSRVRSLLEHDGKLPLRTAALGVGVDALCTRAREQIDVLPEHVGPFRVLERLGAGSTGVVFRAEQEHPRREVAVKLLRGAGSDDRLVRRLAFEAEVLASLDHPGIAHVYAAGWHESVGGALPYLSMELVRGRPLTAWADEAKLSSRARVRLLVEVCEAVAHAHGRGVIHRDLKPDNILVTSDGRPKVLDFGIARMARPDADATTLVGGAGQLVGTLAYMSPEQVGPHPETLDTRADVYALGVIAYRLLAEHAPYDVSALALDEAIRVIQHDVPIPLGRIDRRLRGELETIVAKALEKDPSRRYASAAELGADFQRSLSGEPISARPESSWRHLKRLARRHPLLTVAACGLLMAPFVTTVVQREATRSLKRQTVEQRATQAAWADMLANTALGHWGGEETVAELMQRADILVPHYARGDPGLEGSLWAMVGRCLAGAEVVPGQRLRAEAALQKGVALQAEVFGQDDPRTLSALVDFAEFEHLHGDPGRAAELLVQFGRHANTVFDSSDERLLAARLLEGRLEIGAGRLDRAAHLLEGVASRARLHLGDDNDLALAAASALARSCGRRVALDELVTLLTERLDAGSHDERTVRALLALSGVLLALPGEPTGPALELERRAIIAFETARGRTDPTTRLYWNHHARHQASVGEIAEAECLLATSLVCLQRDPGPRTRPSLACNLQLAELYAASQRIPEAEAAYHRVLRELPRSRFAAMDLVTTATVDLARLEAATGRVRAAERRLLELEACRTPLRDGERDDEGGVLAELRNVYEQLDEPEHVAALETLLGP